MKIPKWIRAFLYSIVFTQFILIAFCFGYHEGFDKGYKLAIAEVVLKEVDPVQFIVDLLNLKLPKP